MKIEIDHDLLKRLVMLIEYEIDYYDTSRWEGVRDDVIEVLKILVASKSDLTFGRYPDRVYTVDEKLKDLLDDVERDNAEQ